MTGPDRDGKTTETGDLPEPRAGRSCPLSYRYAPQSLDRAAELTADVLYVVGGLYGNPFALDAVEQLASHEPVPPLIVFNGDFNWFNVNASLFAEINARVLAHTAIAGNVELELAAPTPGAGCGCAYPESVDEDIVQRSNAIFERLRSVAAADDASCTRLAELGLNAVARVGASTVGIVHGDGASVAGWGFGRAQLASDAGRSRAAAWQHAANVDVFASSHTCEPICIHVVGARGPGLVVNNGAAGMPSLADGPFGIATRIATSPCTGPARIYGTRLRDLHIDALAVRYDSDAWWSCFRRLWPAGSDADLSYGDRMRNGSALTSAVLATECERSQARVRSR